MEKNKKEMLKVQGVTAAFGKRKILDSVDLDIREKSIIAITGKSGSGKSTLLGIMSGLLKPVQGTVLFRDDDIFSWFDFKRSRFRNREIGFIFQFFHLLSDMTAYQNIIYPSAINIFTRNRRDFAEFLIEYMGLKEIRDQYPPTLSGGELQRVAIARAIINNPRLILADEPTGNLDNKTADDIIRLFSDIRDKYGISFVIATHDWRIVKMADIHYHLENGKLYLFEKEPLAKKGPKKQKASVKKTASTVKKAVKKKPQ